MSDVEDNYSASSSDSESEMEIKPKNKKSNAIAAKKTSKLAKPVSDDEDDDDNSTSSVGSNDSDADGSAEDGSDDDDMEPGEMDEDTLFADVAKQNDVEVDEFQLGFDSGNDEDSDLDDDDNGENYLQKLDESVKEQTIANHHPELIIHNYDEVEAVSTVVRDERGVIIDPLHRTLPFLTKYERTRILGERSKQINDGAKPFVESDPSIIDGYLIALKELEEKKLPFIIRRPLNNGASEYWKLRDLEFL